MLKLSGSYYGFDQQYSGFWCGAHRSRFVIQQRDLKTKILWREASSLVLFPWPCCRWEGSGQIYLPTPWMYCWEKQLKIFVRSNTNTLVERTPVCVCTCPPVSRGSVSITWYQSLNLTTPMTSLPYLGLVVLPLRTSRGDLASWQFKRRRRMKRTIWRDESKDDNPAHPPTAPCHPSASWWHRI